MEKTTAKSCLFKLSGFQYIDKEQSPMTKIKASVKMSSIENTIAVSTLEKI